VGNFSQIAISYILQNRISKIFHRLDSRVFVCCRFYQIRTALRVSPKLPVKVEVNLPRNQREYALMTFIKPSKIIAFEFHSLLGLEIPNLCRY